MSTFEEFTAAGAKEAMRGVSGIASGLEDVMDGDWSKKLGIGYSIDLSQNPAVISEFGTFKEVKVMSTGFALADLVGKQVLGVNLKGVKPDERYALYVGETPVGKDLSWVPGEAGPYLFLAYQIEGDGKARHRLIASQYLAAAALDTAIVNGQPLPEIGGMTPPPQTVVANTMLFRSPTI